MSSDLLVFPFRSPSIHPYGHCVHFLSVFLILPWLSETGFVNFEEGSGCIVKIAMLQLAATLSIFLPIPFMILFCFCYLIPEVMALLKIRPYIALH